jgi:hypothetical protein
MPWERKAPAEAKPPQKGPKWLKTPEQRAADKAANQARVREERAAAHAARRAQGFAPDTEIRKLRGELQEKAKDDRADPNNPLVIQLDCLPWHKYNRDLVMKILCSRIASSSCSLGRALATPYEGYSMPGPTTVMEWMVEDPRLEKLYLAAKTAQADYLVEEMLDIADNGTNDTYVDENGNQVTAQDVLGRSRLRVDTRKWVAAKLRPYRYGDSLKLQGDPSAPLEIHAVNKEALKNISEEDLDAALRAAEAISKAGRTIDG